MVLYRTSDKCPMSRTCHCNRAKPATPWDVSQCLLCWNYLNNPRVRAAWDNSAPIKSPSVPEMAVNLAKAAARHIGGGLQKVPLPVYEERIKTCNQCEFLKGGRCGVCGCYVSKKATWATERCPVGKWGAHGSESSGPSTPPGGPTPGGDTGGDTFTHQVDG